MGRAGAPVRSAVRRVLHALFPGPTVLALALAALLVPGMSARAGAFAEGYGLLVYGAGLALAGAFYRSRVFIVLVALALLELALRDDPDRRPLLLALGTAVLALVGMLALMRDRGILSRGGVAQMAAGGGLVAVAIFLGDPERLAGLGGPYLLPLEALGWAGIPRMTLAVAACALFTSLWGLWRWRGPVDRALPWCLLLLVVAMHPSLPEPGSGIFLLATGLTLTLSVVETSYVLAYRDDLTGLPGRRALMQYLDGASGTYTISMVDVDHFKRFNDKHGHDVGDQVLKLVASLLAKAPGGGKAYRYGGEEFTLLYPGRTCEEAKPYLEAVRESVERARFALRSWRRPRKKPDDPEAKKQRKEAGKVAKGEKKPRTLSVTVSLGMADSAGDDDAAPVVLKRADQALYRAKKKGRNQVSG